jgi:WD40 repeat protein
MKNSSLSCSVHNLPITCICLYRDCPSPVLCDTCRIQNHKVHHENIYNIREYFTKLRHTLSKNDEAFLSQIQTTINSKSNFIDGMNKRLQEAENIILDHFDELKKDILFLLDLAYTQYTKQIRDIHSNCINEIDRGMKKFSTMTKIEEMLINPNVMSFHNEEEVSEMVRYLARNQEKMDNFLEHTRLRYQQFEALLENYKSSISVFDPEHNKEVSNSIQQYIKSSFNIKDENSPDTEQRESQDTKNSFTGHEGDICCLSILNKDLIATAGRDSLIKLWNLASGECVGELNGHKDVVWSVLSAYEGKYVLSASSDKTIKVWKISERKVKKTFKAHTKAVLCHAFFQDEKLLASGSQDTSIIVWDMQEGKPIKTLMGHTKAIWALKETKKGNLISGGEDCLIKVWDVKNSVCIQTIHGHKDTIYCIQTFNGDRSIITGSDDETLRVWEIEDGICVQVVKGHEKGVRCIAINSEETLVASGGYDQCLRIWHLKSMKPLKIRDKNDGIIRGVKFYDEYSVLYTDKNVKLFKLNIAQ